MYNFVHSHELLNRLLHSWVSHYAELSLDTFDLGTPDLTLTCTELRDESALTGIAMLSTYGPTLQRRCGPLDTALGVSIYELQDVNWVYLEGRYFSLDYPDGYPHHETPNVVPKSLERLVRECIHTDVVRAALISTFCMRLQLPTPQPVAYVLDQHPPTRYSTRLWVQWVKSKMSTLPDIQV